MARIILAEDDDIISDYVSDILKREGHSVAVLENGKAAVDAMRLRPPQLAILDMNMPVMNGLDTLREMRGDDRLARVPVLMLTAIGGQGSKDVAFYDGANDYLTKPFNPRELVFRAEKLMERARKDDRTALWMC